MYRISFLLIIIFSFFLRAQEKRIYFDKNWKETTEKNAAFYRIQEIYNDSIVFNRDFYLNDNLQNQWYSLKNDLNKRIGSSYWYDENGFDGMSNFTYPNSWKDKEINQFKGTELKYYFSNGKIWNIQMLNGDSHIDKIYDENGNLVFTIEYANRFSQKKINDEHLIFTDHYIERFYWKNTLKIAQEKVYKKNILIKIEDFDKNGNLVNEITKDNIIDNAVFHHLTYDYKLKQGFVTEQKARKNSEIDIEQVINYKNIEWILIGNYFDLYTKIDKNNYGIINTEYHVSDEKGKYRAYTETVEDNAQFSKKEITELQKKANRAFKIDEIKSQSIKSLKKRVLGKVFINVDKTNNQINKAFFLTPEIFITQTYYFDKTDKRQGIGGPYIVSEDDHETKWRVKNSESHVAFILNLNSEKPIFRFESDYGDLHSLIITKEAKGIYLNHILYSESEEKIDENSVYSNFNTGYYYSVAKIGNQYNLYSFFGSKLLKKNYDRIETLGNFVILKKKNKIKVLNSKLEDLHIKKIQSYYVFDNYINILYNKRVQNLDFLGKKAQPVHLAYAVCGTKDCYINTNFEKTENKENWFLYYVESCRYGKLINKISFKNISLAEEPKIIQKINNDFPVTKNILSQYNNSAAPWFIVSKNGKLGLFTYDEKDLITKKIENPKKKSVESQVIPAVTTESSQKNNEIEPVIIHAYAPTHIVSVFESICDAKELLPINYDEIKPIENEPIIIFKKENLYGILFYNQEPKYKAIGKRIDNFIEITDANNQKGWLDLVTNKEYY